MERPKTIRIGNTDQPIERVESVARNGSRWFFWIAGSSLAGTVAALFGLHLVWLLGLGSTAILDLVVLDQPTHRAVTIVGTVAGSALFAFFGLEVRRLKTWPYFGGIYLYTLDLAPLLLLRYWGALAMHLVVLFLLVAHFGSARALEKALQQAKRSTNRAWWDSQ